MSQKLGVGIVGLGMAGGFMAPIVAGHAKVRLVAAADLDASLRERFSHKTGLPADADADALFARPDVDVVYIATPHQFHRDQTIAALKAGKHVVVEKPMALSLDDCDAMNSAAETVGRVLIVGHTHGFDPVPRALREAVASGRHGTLSMLTMMNFTDFIYRPRRPEELDTTKGGGAFFNQLPHQVEIARVIADRDVVSVRCVSGRMDPARPTEGHMSAMLMFEGGSVATIVYSGHDRFDSDELHFNVSETGYPKTPAYGSTWRANSALAGSEDEAGLRRDRYGYGSAAFSGLQSPPHQPHFGFLLVSCASADLRPSADGVLVYDRDGQSEVAVPGSGTFAGHINVWDDCYNAVVHGAPCIQDGAFARETLRITRALLKSAQEDREVRLE